MFARNNLFSKAKYVLTYTALNKFYLKKTYAADNYDLDKKSCNDITHKFFNNKAIHYHLDFTDKKLTPEDYKTLLSCVKQQPKMALLHK